MRRLKASGSKDSNNNPEEKGLFSAQGVHFANQQAYRLECVEK